MIKKLKFKFILTNMLLIAFILISSLAFIYFQNANFQRDKTISAMQNIADSVRNSPDFLFKPDREDKKEFSYLPALIIDIDHTSNLCYIEGFGNGKYLMAYEALLGLLRERYGENVRSCRALELEVSLDLHTPCKRRIVVPENLNFYQLHNVLQECFAWKDCHLHQFVVDVNADGYPTRIIQPQWDEVKALPGVQVQDSTEVIISDIFASRKRIAYEYDFGDGWLHTIDLCRVIDDCRNPYPQCIMAVGDAPIEDCGGPDGFAHVMEVLNNPNHPEHKEVTEWVQSTWWQPLDVKRINIFIKDAHRKSLPVW